MLQQATSVNITIRAIERVCDKLNIRIKDSHKTILAILIPAIIYRDGSIIILSETIHQINRVIQKKNPSIDFVSILLGYNCITHIDKYGAITIPLAFILNKLKLNKDIVSKSTDTLSKKVLTNATQTLCVSEVLAFMGAPKMLSVLVINIILELCSFKLDEEYKIMYQSNTVFKGFKMSDTKRLLKAMEFEKIFLSTGILLLITHIGFNIGSSLIIAHVIEEVFQALQIKYCERNLKTFLN
jgi:galactitol-specific phosphotransferase system IIB component